MVYDHHHNYNLTQSRQEDQEPLPRAVNRDTFYELLDGTWNFALDEDDTGIEKRWFEGHEYSDTAEWPSSIESHIAEKGHKTDSGWRDHVVAWYEREFDHPDHEKAPDPGLNWQITFGACGYETRVWLNGELLTTTDGEEVHVGEYTSFSFEIPGEKLQKINRITVRIADSMDADTPRGKQESHVYKRGGIWYQTYTGAVRSIWLEQVERNRLRSRMGVVSAVEDNLVRINLTTRIMDRGNYRIHLKIFNRKQKTDVPIAEDEYPLFLEPGQKTQRVVIAVPDAKLWSPEHPHLYRVVATLIDEQEKKATIEGHLGLRKIEARGNRVYLNHKPVYLDGVLYQPGAASYEEIKKHMYAMKELGCNLVRIHIAGVDPRIYNLADKLGMLLWVEVPSPHNSNQRSRENHRAELMRMLALIETHPSIIIWSLYNEDWGAQDIATNPETQEYIVDMYHYMQSHHPQFLVVDNDGWKHISMEGRLKSDLLTAHLYMPDRKRWQELLDDLVNGKTEGVAAFPLTVRDPFFYRKQVPLLVSEWGGFGFKDYGGPKDAESQAVMIADYKKDLRSRPIAGDVYTQATNIEDERNGLIDAETAELRVPAGLLHSKDPEIKKSAAKDNPKEGGVPAPDSVDEGERRVSE